MNPRKQRMDSTLDALPLERQTAFFEFAESHTLEQAQEQLALDGIELSMKGISRWCAKKRKEKYDLQFAAHLIEVAAATERAEEMQAQIGETGLVDEKNLSLLATAYHHALIVRDQASIETLGSAYTALMEVLTKRTRAEASMIAAETAREALKTKLTAAIDAGLNALFAEVQAIPEAAELFAKIRELVKAKVGEAK